MDSRAILFSFIAIIFLTASSPQPQKTFLTWGNYKWELTQHADSVYGVVVIPSTKSEWKSALVYSFKDTSTHIIELGVTVHDTVLRLNVLTLEEEQIMYKYSSVHYNIDGGKLSVAKFRRLIKSNIAVTDTGYYPSDFEMTKFNKESVGMWYGYSIRNNVGITKPTFQTGDKVAITFYLINKKAGSEDMVGTVLFELI